VDRRRGRGQGLGRLVPDRQIVDLACQTAKISARAATVIGATATTRRSRRGPHRRPVADNNICQNGTTCVATGEDRRLGDFFTNALDARGCTIIGTGDSSTKDPVTGGERNIALPLFVQQNSGPALRGGGDCSRCCGRPRPAGQQPDHGV